MEVSIGIPVYHDTMLFSLAQEFPVSVWVKRGKCSLRHQVKKRDNYLTPFSLFKQLCSSFQKVSFQSSVKANMSGKEVQGGLSHIKLCGEKANKNSVSINNNRSEISLQCPLNSMIYSAVLRTRSMR